MRGAIFDFDGTLLDTMWIWDSAVERWLEEQGKDPAPGLRQEILRMSLPVASAFLKERYALPQSVEDIIRDTVSFVKADYANRSMPKPGVKDFLARLRAAGVKACIATAGDRVLVEAGLAHCGMTDAFCGIVTCADVGHSKDTPEVYEAALRLLGLPKSDVVVFEDARHAAQTAKNAGFRVVGVYDKSEPEQDELCRTVEKLTVDYTNIPTDF